jgi:hypothetical protein
MNQNNAPDDPPDAASHFQGKIEKLNESDQTPAGVVRLNVLHENIFTDRGVAERTVKGQKNKELMKILPEPDDI